MTVSEDVPITTLTTFRIGGNARYVCTCASVEDIQEALAFARERFLPWYVLGGGSNILANDAGYDGVIIKIDETSMFFKKLDEHTVTAIVGAGCVWEELVRESCDAGFWGLENLAGIPGTVGASPVQNIGAYGVEVKDSILSVEALDAASGELVRFTNEQCGFAYRESMFKHDPALIITRVAFRLSSTPLPKIDYADLKHAAGQGTLLDTPERIADAVRLIRSKKFPDLSLLGTAGSFFKNPTITKHAYQVLKNEYPGIPGYEGVGGVKVSLAWILDNVLHVKGYTQGLVRAFENQPLVLVAEKGATANEVDELATHIEEKVLAATGIRIEREVRLL